MSTLREHPSVLRLTGRESQSGCGQIRFVSRKSQLEAGAANTAGARWSMEYALRLGYDRRGRSTRASRPGYGRIMFCGEASSPA
jgi:hypothetical protein